jgi:hypothetical protein
MATGSLNVRYDPVGDILYVDLKERHADQVFDFIDDFLVGRFNSTTGEVEGFEILFFRQEAQHGEAVRLPLDAKVEPAAIAEPQPVPGSGG